jgi:hypothetical protein
MTASTTTDHPNPGAPGGPPTQRDAGFSLNEYRGKRRPLLLFAPSPADEAYRHQKNLLDAAAARAAERDVVVIEVFDGRQASADGVDIGPAAARDLRDTFAPPADGLTVVLVGKDGAEKLRQTGTVLDPTQLFDLIDSMPMRQEETRFPRSM